MTPKYSCIKRLNHVYAVATVNSKVDSNNKTCTSPFPQITTYSYPTEVIKF